MFLFNIEKSVKNKITTKEQLKQYELYFSKLQEVYFSQNPLEEKKINHPKQINDFDKIDMNDITSVGYEKPLIAKTDVNTEFNLDEYIKQRESQTKLIRENIPEGSSSNDRNQFNNMSKN